MEASQKAISLAEAFARGHRWPAYVASAIAGAAQSYTQSALADVMEAVRSTAGAAEAAFWTEQEGRVANAGRQEGPDPAAEAAFWVEHEGKAAECYRMCIERSAVAITHSATSVTLGRIPLPEPWRTTYANDFSRQTREDELVNKAIRSDFENLSRLARVQAPELGVPVEPAEEGPVGLLWPTGTPSWFLKLAPAVFPVRLPVVQAVSAGAPASPIRHAADPPDVLCLAVGRAAPGEFQDLSTALAWVRDFRAAAPGEPLSALVVLADATGPEAEKESEALAEEGVLVLGRTGEERLENWVAVQAWLPPLVVPGPTYPPALPPTAAALAPPPDSAWGFAQQPAHVRALDDLQFQQEVERFNRAKPWELDY
jgi:hypothetical protein